MAQIYPIFVDNLATTLAGSVAPSDLYIQLVDFANIPTFISTVGEYGYNFAYIPITVTDGIDTERMWAIEHNGTGQLRVLRAKEGTTAKSFPPTCPVKSVVTQLAVANDKRVASPEVWTADIYNIGSLTVYLDPTNGLDTNSGLSLGQPKQTMNAVLMAATNLVGSMPGVIVVVKVAAGYHVMTEPLLHQGHSLWLVRIEGLATNHFWMTTTHTGPSRWLANTAYSIGTIVRPFTPTGYYWKCEAAGTSGGTQPVDSSAGLYETFVDGGVTWRKVDYFYATLSHDNASISVGDYIHIWLDRNSGPSVTWDTSFGGAHKVMQVISPTSTKIRVFDVSNGTYYIDGTSVSSTTSSTVYKSVVACSNGCITTGTPIELHSMAFESNTAHGPGSAAIALYEEAGIPWPAFTWHDRIVVVNGSVDVPSSVVSVYSRGVDTNGSSSFDGEWSTVIVERYGKGVAKSGGQGGGGYPYWLHAKKCKIGLHVEATYSGQMYGDWYTDGLGDWYNFCASGCDVGLSVVGAFINIGDWDGYIVKCGTAIHASHGAKVHAPVYRIENCTNGIIATNFSYVYAPAQEHINVTASYSPPIDTVGNANSLISSTTAVPNTIIPAGFY